MPHIFYYIYGKIIFKQRYGFLAYIWITKKLHIVYESKSYTITKNMFINPNEITSSGIAIKHCKQKP